VYKRRATPAEQLRGEIPVTRFGACVRNSTFASLPPVRRAEGSAATKMRTSIWKMSICGSTIVVLRDRRPRQRIITGGSRPPRELRQIFRLEAERTIGNDWVIRYERRYLQLQPGNRRYGPTQSKALVCEWEGGTMEVYSRGERMAFTEILEPMRKSSLSLHNLSLHNLDIDFWLA
jgi:hypothetical protein